MFGHSEGIEYLFILYHRNEGILSSYISRTVESDFWRTMTNGGVPHLFESEEQAESVRSKKENYYFCHEYDPADLEVIPITIQSAVGEYRDFKRAHKRGT